MPTKNFFTTLLLITVLALTLAACSAKPKQELVFPTPLPTWTPASGMNTPQPTTTPMPTWTPAAGMVTPQPTTTKPVATVSCGQTVTLTYPGKNTEKIGIWFWIAHQYGIADTDPMMSSRDSRYTKAYLQYVGTEKDGFATGFSNGTYQSGKPVTFTFNLPCQ